MKHILEKGEIKELFSDSGEGGWSKEVHIVNYNGEKYVLRRCRSLERAKDFEFLFKKFEKYDFLPKLYGRFENDLLMEYIEGRDLRKKELSKTFEQIGRICAIVNKQDVKQKPSLKFDDWLKKGAGNVLEKAKTRKVRRLYSCLEKRVKVKSTWDCGDLNPDNFRLRKGKVYLVDIDSVIKVVRGYGLGKGLTKWFKSPKQKQAFKKGYSKISSVSFLTEEYEDYVVLYFLIHEIELYKRVGRNFKPNIKKRFKRLDELLKKYEGILE